MEKKTILELTDISLDCLGIVCPPAAAAKRILIGARDIIFREEINKLDQKSLFECLKMKNSYIYYYKFKMLVKEVRKKKKLDFFVNFLER